MDTTGDGSDCVVVLRVLMMELGMMMGLLPTDIPWAVRTPASCKAGVEGLDIS